MNAPETFGAIAATLVAQGYRPLPVVAGQKKPVVEDWVNYKFAPADAARYPNSSVGLLTGGLAGVDIDVRRPELAAELERLAKDALGAGAAPRRIGNPPKVLLMMRTESPLAILKTAGYVFPDDAPEDKKHAVEILGAGQHFVAYGIHPDTQQPYRWNGAGDPLQVRFDALPVITEAQARAFLAQAEAMLVAAGGKPGGKLREADEQRQRSPNETQQASDAKLCRAAIAAIPNDDLSYDDWVYVGYAIKGALGEAGEDAFTQWSAKSSKHDPATTAKLWRGFNPTRIGAGTIHHLAREAGWRPPSEEWKWPEPISESEWGSARLHPDCIVENYLYADVSVMVSPGGTGKTTVILNEAVHIALGRPLWGLEVRKPGPVLIITAEDPRETCVARLRVICEQLDLTAAEQAKVRREVCISDVSGTGFRLTLIAGDMVVPAPTVDVIVRECRRVAPVLVVIDPAVSFGVGESRVNDAEQGLVDAARRIRNELNCCVRYVHHSGKSNAREKTIDQYTSRGGSALPDGTRSVTVLQPLTAEEWAKEGGGPLPEGSSGMILARPKVSPVAAQPNLLIARTGFRFVATVVAPRTPEEKRNSNDDKVHEWLWTEQQAKRLHTKDSAVAGLAGVMKRAEVRDAVERLKAHKQIEVAELPEKQAGRGGARWYLKTFGPPAEQF